MVYDEARGSEQAQLEGASGPTLDDVNTLAVAVLRSEGPRRSGLGAGPL